MKFPRIPESRRIELLEPPPVGGKVDAVLDTDAKNEIDDQFAITYALLSAGSIDLKAVYAAPFEHEGVPPGVGMERSYEEMVKVLDLCGSTDDVAACRGSSECMRDVETPLESEAARDLVSRAGSCDGPLYVMAIGAITNVASALLLEPEIVDRIVVIWLGGHQLHHETARDYNLGGDMNASKALLDSGVPLVLIPCFNVMTHLATNIYEIREHVKGRGAIGEYLYELYEGCYDDHFARTRIIWDIAAVAYLVDHGWVQTGLCHAPLLTDQATWSHDCRRHMMRMGTYVHRDPVFRDFFVKLEKTYGGGAPAD